MRRLIAVAAILVVAGAVVLIVRGGGSSSGGDGGGRVADRGGPAPEHRRSRSHHDVVKPVAGGVTKSRSGGSKPRDRHPKATPRPVRRPTLRPPTRAAFIRQADAICKDAHTNVGRLGRRLLKLGIAAGRGKLPLDDYYARGAALTEQSHGIAQGAVDELKALPRPQDGRIDRYLAASGTQADLLGQQAAAMKRHDGHRVQQLNIRLLRSARRSRQLAGSYGFRVCGGVRG